MSKTGEEDKAGDSSIDSNVVWMDKDRSKRHGHILALLTESHLSPDLGQVPNAPAIHTAFAAFLAWKHLEERRGDVLPELPQLLQKCPDFHWTYEGRDTMLSPEVAVRHLLDATSTSKSNNQQQQISPYAMLGGSTGAVAGPLGTVGSALDIPLISGSAFSPSKEDTDLTTRTIRNVADGHSQAAIRYLRSLNVSHAAFLYPENPCCIPLDSTFKKFEQDQGLTVLPIPYDPQNITEALRVFQKSQYRYVFIIFHMSTAFEPIMLAAYDEGLAGPNSSITWIHCELSALFHPDFALDRTVDSNARLAAALHGSAVIKFSVEPHQAFNAALSQIETNTTIQHEFEAIQPSVNLTAMGFNFSSNPVGSQIFFHTTYDAVITLGLAACNTPGLFTGRDLYQNMLKVDFQGVSGRVAFDPIEKLRNVSTIQYSVHNIRISEQFSDEMYIRFDNPLVAKIDGFNVLSLAGNHSNLSFVYADNSTIMPPSLPPLDAERVELNLIPFGVQIYGCVFAGLVMLLATACIVWTIWNRNLYVIRVSQPVFLVPICIGVIIMASAVFPLSLQAANEEEAQARHLDTACVVTPWLIYIGFVTAVSALFSKTWRINCLTGSARAMQRLTLTPRDSILPFAILLVLNVIVLTAWTLVDSYHYVRVTVDNNSDLFGRSLSSYGACRSTEGGNVMYYFLMPLAAVNLSMVLVAIYECYKARALPIEFAETKYLGMSMASFLESLALGGPILLVTRDDPTAYFAVGATLLCICCSTILLPIFVPKVLNRNKKPRSQRLGSQRGFFNAGSEPVRAIGATADRNGLIGGLFGSSELSSSGGLAGSQDFPSEPRPMGRGMMRIKRRDAR